MINLKFRKHDKKRRLQFLWIEWRKFHVKVKIELIDYRSIDYISVASCPSRTDAIPESYIIC